MAITRTILTIRSFAGWRETVFRVLNTLAVTLLLITLLFAVIAVLGTVDPAVPGL